MEYTASTPRTTRTIAGVQVQVIQPFAAGDPLTEATAAMLNQTLAENFSNNLRKAFTDAAEGADLQAIADEYMAKYQPGVRAAGTGGTRVVDPVEREARKIAKAKAVEIVVSKGLKPKDVDMAAITEQLFTKYADQFLAEGRKVVAALEKAAKASSELDLSGIDLTPAAAAA